MLTRGTAVNRYAGFEEMIGHEEIASVNPTATRVEHLANIHRTARPSAKALGIGLVDPPWPAGRLGGQVPGARRKPGYAGDTHHPGPWCPR
ncbi:hypothetical protein [Amycolatopsis sp. SID8362]|uniref:hypothetical protein n=1 Tax=Amycolatopsis sp. SID8362 TaxID=2690346 RepID=UPI00136A4BAF|nr:hypothetical protein [Amycolatopsis sp. SID8362]NBH02564.1 hypothetical protein [Amycolatopsis sp. SID8362]NED39266.1 hypothetical protein [Amycolatopsis sp. SID8362]